MAALLWALGATLLVSAISLIGVVTLSVKDKLLNKILLILVGLAAGGLMGGAFLHLLPEALEKVAVASVFILALAGFSLFFVLERILFWRHCHKGKCPVHMFTYMNLVGDGMHNFVDGLIIMAGFLTSFSLGIVTTLAVIFHEIPQEIGDFGVLVYGGFSKARALLWNFISALTAVAGAIIGFFVSVYAANFATFLLPIAAGGFIYIASSDLIPEMHKELDVKKALPPLIFFLIGIGLMWVLSIIEFV